MKTINGAVLAGKNRLELSSSCPLPDEPCATGAFVRPLIWSPCTSDAHLLETEAASLPYLKGKAMGHEMCGEVVAVGSDVQDFEVGDCVIACAIMPHWRSLETQDGNPNATSDNMYRGIDYADRGGSFVETYYIRDADMNLAHIPENVTIDQAIMVPDMMCTAFRGVKELGLAFGQSVAVVGIGPVGLMAVRACVLSGAGRVFAVGSRQVCFDVAREYGATDCVDYHEEGWEDGVVETNRGPVDAVMVCGGNEDSISTGLGMLKPGGTLVNLAAFFGGQDIPIDPAAWGFGYGDKTIKGIGCGGGRLFMERMATLISYGRVAPEKLITHRFHGMGAIPDAMQLFLDRDRSLIKAVVYNDDENR